MHIHGTLYGTSFLIIDSKRLSFVTLLTNKSILTTLIG